MQGNETGQSVTRTTCMVKMRPNNTQTTVQNVVSVYKQWVHSVPVARTRQPTSPRVRVPNTTTCNQTATLRPSLPRRTITPPLIVWRIKAASACTHLAMLVNVHACKQHACIRPWGPRRPNPSPAYICAPLGTPTPTPSSSGKNCTGAPAPATRPVHHVLRSFQISFPQPLLPFTCHMPSLR